MLTLTLKRVVFFTLLIYLLTQTLIPSCYSKTDRVPGSLHFVPDITQKSDSGGWVTESWEDSILWEPRGCVWGNHPLKQEGILPFSRPPAVFQRAKSPPSSLSGILTSELMRARLSKFNLTRRKYFFPQR